MRAEYYVNPKDAQEIYVQNGEPIPRETILKAIGWNRITRSAAIQALGGQKLFHGAMDRCGRGIIECTGNQYRCVEGGRRVDGNRS